MKAPAKDCTYACDAFPLGKGDTRVGQVIRAVEVQADVFCWIRRCPILRLTSVVPNRFRCGTDAASGAHDRFDSARRAHAARRLHWRRL
jgi:hypothetical protein